MTDEDVMNDWELGSGLDLDGAEVEITKAAFEVNNNIGSNVLCLTLEFSPLDGSDPVEQSFSVGKGWEADRIGENLVPEGGKRRRINMSSNFGILLASAIDVCGGVEAVAEVIGSPRHAPNWVGSMWRMGTITKMSTNPTTKAEKESTKYIFAAFLGDSPDADADKTEAKSEKPATKSTGARKAASPRGGGKGKGGPPEGVDEELWNQLVDLAVEVQDRDENNDHDDFMDAAMDVDGVNGNKDAQKVIMGTRAGSVWDAAKKRPRDES